MRHQNQYGKVNFRLLIILIVVMAGLGVSLVVARQTRRGILSERALAAGEAAFGNQDWSAAAKSYREYLGRNPDDVEILRKYAESCLSIRPLDGAAVSGAISAYRRVLQLTACEGVACEKLAMLYGGVGNFEELAAMARTRLAHDPNDRKAPLWLAEALSRLNRTAEAQQTLQAFIDQLQPLPGRYAEYVRACLQMSQLASGETSARRQTTADNNGEDSPPTPLDWLNKAVEYSPDSVEVLISRAQFYRRMAQLSSTSEPNRPGLLTLARKDLEAADSKGADNARLLFLLGAEWMAHGELDRAAAELRRIEKLTQEALRESFFDLNEWTVARFLFASELAARKGATAEAASLADETLKVLTEKGQRARVLPSAIQLYAAASRVSEARSLLNEYLSLVRTQPGAAESPRRLAGLQALVAGAENRPYAVIEALEPVVGNDSSQSGLWRLVAEAYDRTSQSGRAVQALVQCRRLNPQDAQVLRELARQYAKTGDWRNAFDVALVAESQGFTDVALKLLRIEAGINLVAGQRDRAREEELQKFSTELADLRQAQPDQVEVRILQAAIADCLGRPEEAESELARAIEECREPLRAELQLARHYVRSKRMKEAVHVSETACQRHPEVAEPWLFLADLHVANAGYDSARHCLTQGLSAVTEKQDKRSLSIQRALLELVHGDRKMGINLLQELASQDRQEIQARSLLLGIREIQADRAAAERLLGELRQAEGESGLWWRLYQAFLWLSSDDWSSRQQEIANLLRYGIEADPAWSAPVLLLAGMYERLGDFRRVEDVCQQGLLQNPSAADIADKLLALLERQGRVVEAEKILQRIQIHPGLASAWQIRLALGAKDLPRAIDALKVRASNDDQDAASRIQLARLVYQETKDAEQAFEYLKQAEALVPDSRMVVAARASILRGEGKSAEALQVLDDHVAKHNEFDAYWMRAVYLAEEGNLDGAEQDYRKLTRFAQNAAIGYELLSNFYAATKRLDRAIETVEAGLGAYPQDLRLKRRLMQMLLGRAQAQDRERALGILAELEEELPQDPELITVRAMQMLQEPTPQSLVRARERLENVVRLQPGAINAHLVLVGVAMRQGEYQSACEYAVRALESNPGQPALLAARARAELALGYTPMAVKLAREARGQDPNNMEALSVIVDGALSGRDRRLLEDARTLVEAALGRAPTNEQLLLSRAHVLAALEMSATAIPQLETYCQTLQGSRRVKALVTLADLYRLAGDTAGAGKWVERAEQLGTHNQAVVHARFLWLVAQKRYEELGGISSAYLSAQEQDPRTVLRAASTLLSLGSMDLKKEAVRLFEHAVALAPMSVDARFGLASSLYQTGEVDGAEKAYRRLLEQYPDDVRVLNDLAWILQEHGQRYADALDLANKGLRLAPDDLHLLDTRGTILSNLPDRLADARRDYEDLVRLSSSDARGRAKALLQLGRVCAKLSDLPQARQHLQTALEIDQKADVFTAQERSEIRKVIEQTGV